MSLRFAVCENCGAEFSAHRAATQTSPRFCSVACRLAACAATVNICEVCGATFVRPDAGLNRANRFCSKMCNGQGQRKDAIATILSLVDRSGGPNACWPFRGQIQPNGYGRLTANGKSLYAHRVAYEDANGPLPPGYEACHNCPGGDNRACCNPAHLFAGTHTDNMRDMIAKGRGRYQRQRHP